MKKIFFIVFLVASISTSGQTILFKENVIPQNDSLKMNVYKKSYLKIGIMAGSHSSNLDKNNIAFKNGLFLETYLKYRLSDELHSIIGLSYWKANIETIISSQKHIPETVSSMALNLGLEFLLIQRNPVLFSFSPTILIENISTSTSPIFSFGSSLGLSLNVWGDMNILSVISYQFGTEALNFGGGVNYSFIKYLLGIEIDITKLLKNRNNSVIKM